MTLTLFFISTFLSLTHSAFLPSHHLLPYASFLAYLMFEHETRKTFYYSFFCGLTIDIFSTDFVFGFYSLLYLLSLVVIHLKKILFIHAKTLFIPLYTFFISFFLTTAVAVIKIFLGMKTSLSLSFFLREALMMPLFDAFFALIFYSLPIKTLQILRKKGFTFKFFTHFH